MESSSNTSDFHSEENKTIELTQEQKDAQLFDDFFEFFENYDSCKIALYFKSMTEDILQYSNKDKTFYFYNAKTFLWEGGKDYENHIRAKFVSMYHQILDRVNSKNGPMPLDTRSEQYRDWMAKNKLIKTIWKETDSDKANRIIRNYLAGVYDLTQDIGKKLNKRKDLLPLANGVWSFKENKLIPYQKDHYFTFKLSTKYNEKADTSLIEKAVNMWYSYDKEIIEMAQYYFGYCMTGYTSRKEALVVWGSSANNGKTTFWSSIMRSIMESFYKDTLSTALSIGSTSKNDSLFRSEDKRICLMNEPRMGGKEGIDNSLFKSFVCGNDETMEVEGRGTNNIKEMSIISKLVITCNQVPDFNFDDRGVYNRIVFLEQNIPFVTKEEYEKADDELKKTHKIQPLDDEFLEKLTSNKEAILLWGLKGASMFMEAPKRPVPEKMQVVKQLVKQESNEMALWIERFLEPLYEMDSKNLDEKGNFLPKLDEKGQPIPKLDEKVTLSSIKMFWKRNDIDFGQKKHGFNEKFLKECEKAGYKTNAGRKQKAEEVILGCKRIKLDSEKEFPSI
jgi:phage/plasmid-associated DNA primase